MAWPSELLTRSAVNHLHLIASTTAAWDVLGIAQRKGVLARHGVDCGAWPPPSRLRPPAPRRLRACPQGAEDLADIFNRTDRGGGRCPRQSRGSAGFTIRAMGASGLLWGFPHLRRSQTSYAGYGRRSWVSRPHRPSNGVSVFSAFHGASNASKAAANETQASEAAGTGTSRPPSR